jgi:hypothetical protein
MGKAKRHYTSQELDDIRSMAANGRSGIAIAKKYGTTPDRLYCVLSYYKIHLLQPRRTRRPTRLLGGGLETRFAVEADSRGITSKELMRKVLEVVTKDNLFSALLDMDDTGKAS